MIKKKEEENEELARHQQAANEIEGNNNSGEGALTHAGSLNANVGERSPQIDGGEDILDASSSSYSSSYYSSSSGSATTFFC